VVNRIKKTNYECPLCGKKYDDYDDCIDCIENCTDIETPEKTIVNINVCEICKAEYDEYEEAYNCEEKHKNKQDLQYQTYLDLLEKEKLLIAGEHPKQKKLKEVN